MRDRIFDEMTDEWKAAYEAGVFTEFMEQRAPGHTVLDGKIYRKGLLGLQGGHRPRASRRSTTSTTPRRTTSRQQLRAMRIAADAIIRFAAPARRGGRARWRPPRRDPRAQGGARADRRRSARGCPSTRRATFWEALQAYWFVHLGVITELNTWDSFCPGRLDQHLYPFYRREIEAGTLTRERAKELLAVLLGEVQQPAGAAEGRRDGGRERHLHRLLPTSTTAG